MTQRGASIHFQPVKDLAFSLSHAFREGKPPSYVFKGAAAKAGVHAPVLELGHTEIKRRHTHRVSQGRGASKHSAVYWEGVLNLPAFTPPIIDGAPCQKYTAEYLRLTNDRLKTVSQLLETKYGLYAMFCVTHLDEGHIDKKTGLPVYNPHAHILVDRRGRDVTNTQLTRLLRADLKNLQTDVALLMGMPRGKSGGRRISASEYRERKRLEEKAREEKAKALEGWNQSYKAWEAVCAERDAARKAAKDAQDAASRLQQQVADLQVKADEGARALQGAQTKVVRLQQYKEKFYRREIRARMVASGGYGPRDYRALSRLSGDALESKLAEFESWWRRLSSAGSPQDVDWDAAWDERPLFGPEPDPNRPGMTQPHWEGFLANLHVSNSPFESREQAQPQPATGLTPAQAAPSVSLAPSAPAQAQLSAEELKQASLNALEELMAPVRQRQEQRQRRTDLPSPFGRPSPSPFGRP